MLLFFHSQDPHSSLFQKPPARLPNKFYIILGSEFILSAEINSLLCLTRAFKLRGIQNQGIWFLMTLINNNMLRNRQIAVPGRRREDNIKRNVQ